MKSAFGKRPLLNLKIFNKFSQFNSKAKRETLLKLVTPNKNASSLYLSLGLAIFSSFILAKTSVQCL